MREKPRRLFGLLCAHEWEVVGEGVIKRNVYRASKPEEILRTLTTGTTVLLRCKHCSDLKQRDFRT